MKVSSVLFPVVVLIIVISILCVWFYPSIQDYMASNTMWNGIKNFSSEFNADTIESLDELPDIAENTVLVSIPYLGYSNEELLKLKGFIEDGGTLILMDDYGYGNSVLASLGVSVRFTNKPLLDPLFCYKNQWLPRITNLAPRVKENSVDVIVFNHATTLTDVEQTDVIAWSSNTSFLDINENESWDEDEPNGPFPVAAEIHFTKGTLTLVSDPSIIINSMAGRDDNYNFVKYLVIHHKDEQKTILVDISHLTKTPLDISKTRLTGIREMLSTPYPLLGIVALVFVVVSRYTLKKGEYND